MMQARGFALFLAVYAVTMAALLSRLSLWLDEILQLIGARKQTLAEIWEYAARNAGGVPLGYLLTHFSLGLPGDPAFAGRFPSLLAGVLCLTGIFVLARRLGARTPLLAVVLFALCPLEFRYALEARPYEPALAVVIWSTVVFLQLAEQPTWPRAVLYGVLACAGLFLQAYSIFLPLSHLAWAMVERNGRLLRYAAPPLVLACASFVPWYLYGVPFWKQEIAGYAIHPRLNWSELLLIVKELSGAGYVGTILLFAVAAYGLRKLDRPRKLLWLAMAILPIAAALAANLVLGYFLAIRQVIYVLAPLALLCALGLEDLWVSYRPCGAIFTLILLGAFFYGDVRNFTRPREDWKAAARQLARDSSSGACAMVVPPDSWKLYDFFEPGIARPDCLETNSTIVVAVSPYESQTFRAAAEARLHEAGWLQTGEKAFQGPELLYFTRSR